jgi:hypothetical protein
MTREEWIKIYNAKDGTWDKDDLIDKAYEIITSPIKTNYDRIKSMSVNEMTSVILMLSEKVKKYPNARITLVKQWLLQEVSENDR